MFKAIWSCPMVGWEAICQAFKASSAFCDETQVVRTTGAHQVVAQMVMSPVLRCYHSRVTSFREFTACSKSGVI